MSSKKKINPRRKPVNMADVNKAKSEAVSEAIETAWAIFFTVMRDKEGYGVKRLQRIWGEVNELSDSISKGYVNVSDLANTLKEEAGIVLR